MEIDHTYYRIGGIVAFLTFVILARIIYSLWLSPHSHIPGPRICKITRLWVDYHDFFLQRNQQIYKWHEKYGPVVLIAPGEVSFSSPTATREVYRSATRHPKGGFFNNFLMYGERPIFCTLDCTEHRKMRKRTFAFYQPASIFKPSILYPIRSRVNTFLSQLGNDTGLEGTVNFFIRCNCYAFDNITALVYGPSHGAKTMTSKGVERSILDGWAECEVWNNLLYSLPLVHKICRSVISYTTKNPDFLAAEEKLTTWNWTKLSSAMRDQDSGTDDSLLRRLQDVKSEDGSSLSAPWIAAESLDNIHAAQTTVALALTYAIWNLAYHPQWQEMVREELEDLTLEDDGLPSYPEVKEAKILDAFIRESFRINPLSSGRAERVVPVTKEYDDVVVPSGTTVSTSTTAIHRSPVAFINPNKFDPKRWLQADESHLRIMESCYLPFGYGARVCLGEAFAVAEIKLLLAGLLLNFEICQDPTSGTNASTMVQLGTQNALPRGRRCDLSVRRIN